MKRRFALLFAAAFLVTVAACSTAASNKEAGSPTAASPAAQTSKPPEANHPAVEAAHISFQLPEGWTIQTGEESFGLQRNGSPVGGLDGLGYSESIDGLLPNGASVDSQTELTGVPVKAVETKLTLDGQGDGEKREEYHFFFFLTEQKAVYDLHFDSKQVQLEEARKIAQTGITR